MNRLPELTGLAARTVSGKTPPTGFLITLWTLAIFFSGSAIAMLVGGLRARKQAAAVAAEKPDDASASGYSGKAGCLLVSAFPAALLGLFFFSWIIGIS